MSSEKTLNSTATGRVPLSEQIAEMLLRDIHSGKLPDGERLPPEREMAGQLRISVGTLRKALAELEAQNLLERVQGSGNYIRKPADIENIYALFRLELISGPARPGASLLSLKRLLKPTFLPPMSHCKYAFRFRRLRKLDETQAALEEIWLDGRFSDSINKTEVLDSLYQFYHQRLGVRITRVEDQVSVNTLPLWAPAQLQASASSHWGYIERLSQDQNGEPAEFSKTWFDPATVRFVTR